MTMLYKFTTSAEIARQVSVGIFRFYELTKYIKIEDHVGRSDPHECSISFNDTECIEHPEKIPTASFNGIEFKCVSMRPDEKYISQYFVFCMSTVMNADVIGDSTHVVELNTDTFETFELLLCNSTVTKKHKLFSHDHVEYYDIHNHPIPFGQEIWREVYVKHSDFKSQHEYRAALFVSEHFFEKNRNAPTTIARPIFQNNVRMAFDLKISMRSGIDPNGWRYIELDISEFSANLTPLPCKIMEIALPSKEATQNS